MILDEHRICGIGWLCFFAVTLSWTGALNKAELIESSIALVLFPWQHMRSPSVSCLDVDTSPPTSDSSSAALTPSTPTKSHRRSASCGNNPTNSVQGSGPDMRIIRIRMDLQDGNLYRSILVGTWDSWGWVSAAAVTEQNVICHMLHLQALICQDAVMIVIRVRSSGYRAPRISLEQIKLSGCHCDSPLSLPAGYEQWQDPHCDQLCLRKAQSGPQTGVQIRADPAPARRKRWGGVFTIERHRNCSVDLLTVLIISNVYHSNGGKEEFKIDFPNQKYWIDTQEKLVLLQEPRINIYN